MGMTYIDGVVRGPEGKEATVRFLVDSGAGYSLLPRPVWKAIGLEPVRSPQRRVGVRGRFQPLLGDGPQVVSEHPAHPVRGACDAIAAASGHAHAHAYSGVSPTSAIHCRVHSTVSSPMSQIQLARKTIPSMRPCRSHSSPRAHCCSIRSSGIGWRSP